MGLQLMMIINACSHSLFIEKDLIEGLFTKSANLRMDYLDEV